jgi:uncharacterized protein YaiI (UPF0178 family)
MKYLFSVLIIFLSLTVFAQSDLFKTNLNVAKQLYSSGIIQKLLSMQNLSDDQRQALALAEYYKFSQQDIPLPEMRDVVVKYYKNQNYSQSEQSVIEAQYGKLMNQIEQLMNEKNLSFLSNLLKN